MFPKTDWLMRFVARLLELKPELTPAAAVMVAIEAFDSRPMSTPPKRRRFTSTVKNDFDTVCKAESKSLELFEPCRLKFVPTEKGCARLYAADPV
jgi:hypothetical protein